MILKCLQNYPKMVPKLSQHHPKMIPKWSQNDPKMILKWSQNDPKIILKWSQNDPKMILKWSQNNSKIVPRWFQNDPKMISKWSQHLFTIALVMERKKLSPEARKQTRASESLKWNEKTSKERTQKVIPGGTRKKDSSATSLNDIKKSKRKSANSYPRRHEKKGIAPQSL